MKNSKKKNDSNDHNQRRRRQQPPVTSSTNGSNNELMLPSIKSHTLVVRHQSSTSRQQQQQHFQRRRRKQRQQWQDCGCCFRGGGGIKLERIIVGMYMTLVVLWMFDLLKIGIIPSSITSPQIVRKSPPSHHYLNPNTIPKMDSVVLPGVPPIHNKASSSNVIMNLFRIATTTTENTTDTNTTMNVNNKNEKNMKKKKILCVVISHSGHHTTKIKAIRDTWGTKCDGLLIASNQTDLCIGAINVWNTTTTTTTTSSQPNETIYDESYSHLWEKVQVTMEYLWKTYIQLPTEYEWFLKIDDDTYVILENLNAFLHSSSSLLVSSQVVQQQDVQQEQQRMIMEEEEEKDNDNNYNNVSPPPPPPLIYGRRFAWPSFQNIDSSPEWAATMTANPNLLRRLKKRLEQDQQQSGNSTTTWNRQYLIYNAGGAGYVFNRSYLKLFMKLLSQGQGLDDNSDNDNDNNNNNNNNNNNYNDAQQDNQQNTIGLPRRRPTILLPSNPPPPEDMALALLMYTEYGILPQESRDEMGRERFHPELPHIMYQYQPPPPSSSSTNQNNSTAKTTTATTTDTTHQQQVHHSSNFQQTRWNYLYQFHEHVPPPEAKGNGNAGRGGIQGGPNCCSPYSISFHHVKEKHMYHLHQQFYNEQPQEQHQQDSSTITLENSNSGQHKRIRGFKDIDKGILPNDIHCDKRGEDKKT